MKNRLQTFGEKQGRNSPKKEILSPGRKGPEGESVTLAKKKKKEPKGGGEKKN